MAIVPDATLEALRFVKLAPETFGNVPVPEPKSVLLAIATSKLDEPLQNTVVLAPCVIATPLPVCPVAAIVSV